MGVHDQLMRELRKPRIRSWHTRGDRPSGRTLQQMLKIEGSPPEYKASLHPACKAENVKACAERPPGVWLGLHGVSESRGSEGSVVAVLCSARSTEGLKGSILCWIRAGWETGRWHHRGPARA